MTQEDVMNDGTPYPYYSGPIDNGYKLNIMPKQTAVDWLANELKSKGHALITSEGIFINVPNELIEQAKAMEREQIIDAYYYGATDVEVIDDLADAKLYYDETYKK